MADCLSLTKSPVSVVLDGLSISLLISSLPNAAPRDATINNERHGCTENNQEIVVSKRFEKSLVSPIYTTIEGASLFGILGGSGSGKTTLLNVIANRYDKSAVKCRGTLSFEGRTVGGIGYVTQNDFLLPFLTVRETLLFSAKLKTKFVNNQSDDISKVKYNNKADQIHEIVDKIILDLGLKECAATIIGGEALGKRGVSGGEKRRVSVAIQIITDPEILCADEPTSGLDSFTANTVIQSLLNLTRDEKRRTTVICSIHQPRADVFFSFHSILLLSRGGHVIYCGPTKQIVAYFEQLGLFCPVESNPADYFVDISSLDDRNESTLQTDRIRLQKLIKYASSHCNNKNINNDNKNDNLPHTPAFLHDADGIASSSDRDRGIRSNLSGNNNLPSSAVTSWWLQVYILGYRFLLNNVRDPYNFYGGCLKSLILGLVLMAIFWDLSDASLVGIRSRYALFYTMTASESYSQMVIFIERFGRELRVFDREYQDTMYSPSAYLMAHVLTSLPQLVLQGLLFSLPSYYGCRLRLEDNNNSSSSSSSSGYILIYLSTHIIMQLVINGLAWVCVSAQRPFAVASLIGNTVFSFIGLVSGFLINFHDIPVYVSWVRYISYTGYAYRIFMSNEFSNRIFNRCEVSALETCDSYNGNKILKSQQIGVSDFKYPFLGLIIIGVIYHIIALLLLTFVKFPPIATVGGEISSDDIIFGNNNGASDDKLSDEEAAVAVESFADSQAENVSYGEYNGNNNLEPPVAMNQSSKVISTSSKPFQSIFDHKPTLLAIDICNISLYVPSSAATSSPFSLTTTTIINKSLKTSDSQKPVSTTSNNNNNNNNNNSSVSHLHGSIDLLPQLPSKTKSSDSNNLSNKPQKCILANITGRIVPQRLVALMGGSGSGKTTLLNIIAGRIPLQPPTTDPAAPSSTASPQRGLCPGLPCSTARSSYRQSEYTTEGKMLFNGHVPSRDEIRQQVGYVQQFDHHLPSLTVTETLAFHCNLRFPTTTSPEAKRSRVRDISQLLGLSQCAATRVGGEDVKGISGGEKRRLSIGIQLLCNPSICLLDEPTTGLDAFTARHIVETLRDFARTGRTIILSIHQPRYDIFSLLDDVLLLSRGHQIWSGNSSELLLHFASCGLVCPALVNPADFILDMTSIDFRDPGDEVTSRQRLQYLIEAFNNLQSREVFFYQTNTMANSTTNTTNNETTPSLGLLNGGVGVAPTPSPLQPAGLSGDHSLYYTLPIVLSRSFTNQNRQLLLMSTRVTQGMFYALILACFYAPLGHDQNAIQNRVGLIYEHTPLLFIGMLGTIAIFPAERDVFYREYMDGGYSVAAFFITYFLLVLPYMVLSSFTFTLLMTYAVGLESSKYAILYFTYVIFCFVFCGECVGVAFCAIFDHIGFSVNIISVFLSILTIMSGLFSLEMPVFLDRINHISPVKWGVWILMNVGFEDITFTCVDSEKLADGHCPLANGQQVLQLYRLDSNSGYGNLSFYCWVLAFESFIYFLIAYILLRLKCYKLSH